MNERNPFWQLLLARMREFGREPEILFWVFGFPILLAVGLGIAFRNKPADRMAIGVLGRPGAEPPGRGLAAPEGCDVDRGPPEEAAVRPRESRVRAWTRHPLLGLPDPVADRRRPGHRHTEAGRVAHGRRGARGAGARGTGVGARGGRVVRRLAAADGGGGRPPGHG